MPNWLDEFLLVLSVSPKTQWAFILGAVFFIGILLLGHIMTGHFEFQGSLKPLQDAFAEKIGKRYDKVAWIALISFWGLAVKHYRKDRDRIL